MHKRHTVRSRSTQLFPGKHQSKQRRQIRQHPKQLRCNIQLLKPKPQSIHSAEVGSRLGIHLDPDDIHIMDRSQYDTAESLEIKQ